LLLNPRVSTALAWQARAAFRVLCWLATPVGKTMVALAAAFRACTRASGEYGSVVIPAQLALLLAWAPTRLLFLALHSAAVGAFRAEGRLRRGLAVAN